MARRILALRHAKSAWPPGVGDLERPLARRGERDCEVLGAFLAACELQPDHVVCSPAVRTRETARRVLAAAGCRVTPQVEAELYEGDVLQVLREVPDQVERLLVVGHQPELEDLLRTLCGADTELPTAALAVLEVEAPWALLPAGRAVLRTLVTPKLLGRANWTTVYRGT